MNPRCFRYLLTAIALLPFASAARAADIGTAFTYQGQLKQDGAPANGNLDMEFLLFDAATLGNQVGDPMTLNGVGVSNGLFTVTLNAAGEFGPSAFNGEARWLAITVGGTPLTPRQKITAAPHALALPGLYTQQNATSPNIIGGFSGNTVTPGRFGATIGGGGDTAFPNQVTGDYGTVGGGQSNTASGGNSTVGGGFNNSASAYVATVGGGAANRASDEYATVGGGVQNTARKSKSTVSGGQGNNAMGIYSTVGGGSANTASGGYGTIGGGQGNTASEGGGPGECLCGLPFCSSDLECPGSCGDVPNQCLRGPTYTTVCGGGFNTASGQASTVGGGAYNTASGQVSTVGGGAYNTASGSWSTVPGGDSNEAGGDYSFAAGRQAHVRSTALGDLATDNGTFVWADNSTGSDFISSGPNQFLIRASGGVGINTNSPTAALHVGGTAGVDGIKFPDGTLQTTAASGGGGGGTLDQAYDFGGPGAGRTITADSGAVEIAGADGLTVAGTIQSGSSVTIDGTADSENIASSASLDLRVAAGRALRLEDNGSSSPNIIGGYSGNIVLEAVGATIGGGGAADDGEGNPIPNGVLGHLGTVGGGAGNFACSLGSPLGPPGTAFATVAGGYRNSAIGSNSSIGGGRENRANGGGAAIAGGVNNSAGGAGAAVAGGFSNRASAYASVVPGGYSNEAGGVYSFAAGRQAKVAHEGTFSWADSTDADFTSTGPNQFLIRASGGVGIGTPSPAAQLDVNGAARTTTLEIIGGSPLQQPQPLAGWGDNTSGQTNVPSGTFTAVAGGGSHSLAIRSGGTLVGWGSNSDGQINVPSGTFTAVAAGGYHSLAIRSDGTLVGWGYNGHGEITVPAGMFTAVAAGYGHSLAIRSDGTLVGWGLNDQGQINVPVGTFTAVAAGQYHSLAIRSDGTLVGWGYNNWGQTNVPAGTFTAIAAGQYHSLAIRRDGTLAGWGYNGEGQINVPSGTFTAVAAGARHSLAIRSDGTLVGWGENAYGQINVPASTFSAVAAGYRHSLAIWSEVPAGPPALLLHSNTAYKPGTNTWTISSDRRLKKNIEPLSGALERLLQLHGVTFQWLDPASQGGITGTQMGLIADEVSRAFPQWVGRDPKGYQTLTVGGFEALTAEALRELREEKDCEIDELKARLMRVEALLEGSAAKKGNGP